MSQHLPLRLYRPLNRQRLVYLCPSRTFSSTSTRAKRISREPRKRGHVDPVVATTAARHQQGKASSALQEEQMSDERNIPDDIGLIPGTFVRTPISRQWLSPWYGWKWVTSRATAWYQLWRFRNSFKKQKPKMYWIGDRKQLACKAKEKYRGLYESFAKGDKTAISQVCLSEVAKKFKDRIDSRPPGLTMQWYMNGTPNCNIVSNLASPLSLPGYEETGIHQVVFRIQSNQTLKLTGSRSSAKDMGSGDIVEYLVLQRRFIRGDDKGWKIWGFTNASTPSTIEASEEYARTVNEFQVA